MCSSVNIIFVRQVNFHDPGSHVLLHHKPDPHKEVLQYELRERYSGLTDDQDQDQDHGYYSILNPVEELRVSLYVNVEKLHLSLNTH